MGYSAHTPLTNTALAAFKQEGRRFADFRDSEIPNANFDCSIYRQQNSGNTAYKHGTENNT